MVVLRIYKWKQNYFPQGLFLTFIIEPCSGYNDPSTSCICPLSITLSWSDSGMRALCTFDVWFCWFCLTNSLGLNCGSEKKNCISMIISIWKIFQSKTVHSEGESNQCFSSCVIFCWLRDKISRKCFSHKQLGKWDEMHRGVVRSHDLLESNLFIAIYLACPAPRTYPSHAFLQGKGAVII